MVVLGVGLLLAGIILILFGAVLGTKLFSFVLELLGGGSISTVCFVLGGILVVVGILLIIFGYKKKADANKKSE
ncbi:MAG: hypothetical protein J1E00_08095 [Oscillospiraceae bacterium]|nr:hypothetical protein [Oscillospiraceae bacterium]